ncbi:major facilitator superfamily transporter [Phlyctema vagabunda]|uniref:Major facilitator superfamily transporter n=1 Tax=Phlyctema vagabunda TaxID=108571 RepID=A0ABR4PEU0_9HELO
MGSPTHSPVEIPLANLDGPPGSKKGVATSTVICLPAGAESVSTLQTHDIELAQPASCTAPANLPPVDGGRQAWLFLVGCFFFEALIWGLSHPFPISYSEGIVLTCIPFAGFPFSFGVFEAYYSTHLPWSDSPSGIAIIGTCATGTMYLFAPVSLHFLEAYPSFRRLTSVFGLVLSLSALVASSFVTQVWKLILTQGILYAIGGSLLYAPTNIYLSEWFVKKQGLAIGVMWSGVGFAGFVFPYLLSFLLRRYGVAKTLRIWALVLFVAATPLIYFIRPRLPIAAHRRRERVDHGFLCTRTFWVLQVANVAEGLGFFMPAIYLPLHARSLGVQIHGSASLAGAILLSLINSLSSISAPLFGYLCDRWSVYAVMLLSSLGSTLAVMLLWYLAPLSPLPLLLCFAAAYGVFAGGWSAIWSGMIGEVQRVHPRARLGSLMGLLSAGRGVGAVCSGPISARLLLAGHGGPAAAAGFAGPYANVVLFTAVTAVLGAVPLVLLWWRGDDGIRRVEEGEGEGEGGREGEE